MRQALLLPLFTICVCAALAAQSTVTQHGEVVFGSGRPMPPSLGASPNDFPVGAVMLAGGLVTAAVQPVLDAEGALVFVARARSDVALGITAANAQALMRGRSNGDLRLLLRQGDPIPGLPATTQVSAIAAARTSPFHGHVLVAVNLQDLVVPSNTPTTADTALLVGQPGAWQVLMREGDVVPAVGPGSRYGEVDAQAMGITSTGAAVFRNNLQSGFGGVTTANQAILLFGTPGNLAVVARQGSPWNGVGASGELVERALAATSFVAQNVRLLDDGRVLHDVRFAVPTGSASSTANDRVLAVWNGGVDTVLAREGVQAPGMPAGAVFTDSGLSPFAIVSTCPITRSGRTVFSATFPTGPGGVTTANDRATFLHDGTSLSLVVREGDAAPAALGAGVTFGLVAIGLVLAESGSLVFSTSLGGAVVAGNDSALFLGAPGALTAIAREGDPVPGLPGHVFGDLANVSPAATERGDVLCIAPVSNGTTRSVAMQFTAQHGWRVFFDTADPMTAALGTTTLPTQFGATIGQTADNGSWLMNNQGDVAFVGVATGTEQATLGCTYLRCHVGTMVGKPATVPAAGGVPQQFAIDCGPANANRFYFVLATSAGTRPGFPSPLGPQLVPLNFDPTWTNLSVSFANSSVWTGTFGVTDASGRGIGPLSFTLPAGLPGLAGLSLHHAAVLFDTALVSQFVTEPSGLLLR